MNVGKGIKFVRLAADLRQGDMAKRLDISQNYLSLIENNKAEPSLGLLKRIAAEFGVPASFLLWEDTMPEEAENEEVTARYSSMKSLIRQLQEYRIAKHCGGASAS
jgi:transcriptional regulator with XRE-family HTH domain